LTIKITKRVLYFIILYLKFENTAERKKKTRKRKKKLVPISVSETYCMCFEKLFLENISCRNVRESSFYKELHEFQKVYFGNPISKKKNQKMHVIYFRNLISKILFQIFCLGNFILEILESLSKKFLKLI